MALLVKQCQAPLKLRSVLDRKHIVTLIPREPKLYSGSVITTATNNIANVSIGMSIADLDEIRPELIEGAAKRAGYLVTGCTPLPFFEKVQFLKHSPVLVGGEFLPILNIGVLLRLSGTCKGDLPGRGPLAERARIFQRALLRGAYPYTSCTLIDAMKARVADAGSCPRSDRMVSDALRHKVLSTTEEIWTVSDEALYKRYNFSLHDIHELHQLCNMDVGWTLNCQAAAKILAEDYNMSTADDVAPALVAYTGDRYWPWLRR